MLKNALLFAAVLFVLPVFAQNRKLPNLSFQEHSIEFANANRRYDEHDQFVDTLKDQRIIEVLIDILTKNPALNIEVGGHTALNEDTTLAIQRAEYVQKMLVDGGISEERIDPISFGHRFPIIKDEVLFSLPSKVEREAANQKNRRAEVKVIASESE